MSATGKTALDGLDSSRDSGALWQTAKTAWTTRMGLRKSAPLGMNDESWLGIP